MTIPAAGADLASAPRPVFVTAQQNWSWTGGHIGVLLGGGTGSASFSDPYGASIYGDRVRTPSVFGGGEIGFDYQVPGTRYVLGIAGDGGALGLYGTNTCDAFSGFYVPQTCRVQGDALASATGRIGYASGPDGHTLVYVKGGAAFLLERRDVATNGFTPYGYAGGFADPTSNNDARTGFTVGAGVEQALTPAWSLKIEYDYADFGDTAMPLPGSIFQQRPPNPSSYRLVPGATTSVRQDIHLMKVGLNYRLGADPSATWHGAAPADLFTGFAPGFFNPGAGYAVEAGGRYWYSFSRFRKDLGAFVSDNRPNTILLSRLTYEGTTNSGEFYGRIDTPYRVFIKGYVGAGSVASGHLNDEDYYIGNATIPYSNTISSEKGTIDYATVDLGYSFFQYGGARAGGFVGYNHYNDNKTGVGCTQIADRFSDCVPPIPTSKDLISENDRWDSLRLGLTGDIPLGLGFRLTGDAAYLPYVRFHGLDDHYLRFDVTDQLSPERGTGQGVQLEAIVSYAVTPNLDIGIGGRYWAMWSTNATVNQFGLAMPQTQPVQTERYGGFVQAAYRFGGTAAPVVAKY